MEYLEGSDLAHLVGRYGGLPVPDACEVIRQAALGLHFVHEGRNLVHRDIKPSNLMITPSGCVKVLDLGLALLSSSSGGDDRGADFALTDDGDIIGSVDYMAPEQWLGSHSVDRRADLYSLGCTLYHILTGAPPFADPSYDTRGKKMMAHANDQPRPIGDPRPDTPEELATILCRLMAKRPAERYATAGEVAEALLPLAVGHDLPSLLRGSLGGMIDHARIAPAQDVVASATTEALTRRPAEHVATITPAHEARHERRVPSWRPLRPRLKAWKAIAIGSAVIVSLLGVILWRTGALDDDVRMSPGPGSPTGTFDRLEPLGPSVPGSTSQTRPAPEIKADFRVNVYRVDARDHDAFLDLGELGGSVSLPRQG